MKIEAYCTFCRVELVEEDDHMKCPECLGRFSISVSAYPLTYPESAGSSEFIEKGDKDE